MGRQRAFCQFLDADAVKLLDLFHDEFRLVDLDDEGGATCIPAGKAKLAESVLDGLGNVDCLRLEIGLSLRRTARREANKPS